MALAAVNRPAAAPAGGRAVMPSARRGAARLVAGIAPLVLAWSPLAARVPVLGVFRGPLGPAWAVLTVVVALAAPWKPRCSRSWDPGPRTLFALAALVYL